MSNPTDELVQFDAIIAQYRAELERLNYVRGSIDVYLRSIKRFFRLIEEQGVALGDLAPDAAADLIRRATWRCDRQQYAVFIVKRFVEYLSAQGMAKPPMPPTPAEMVRAALRRDYENYLHRQGTWYKTARRQLLAPRKGTMRSRRLGGELSEFLR
jgi:hypothetical protein